MLALFELARLYLAVFGVLTIAGGVMGYVKARSRASILAGSVAGGLLLVASWLVSTQGRNGLILGCMVSISLAIRFVKTYLASRKVMPAGIMAVLGIAGVGLTSLALWGR